MTHDNATLRPLLQSGSLRQLFAELGWDNLRLNVPVKVGADSFVLEGVAHKKGVQVFVCPPASDGRVPSSAVRARIDTELRKSAHEHLIIFVDGHAPPRHQYWLRTEVEPGKPRRFRFDEWHHGHSGDRILQKLDIIRFDLREEGELTLAGHVVPRLDEAFGRRDKVTKKFFERFQQEHRKFLGFIQGISAQGDRDWYASVMLNRLMFVYFIQKKRFLDDDLDYLNNRLRLVRAQRGKGQFHSFYRAFLRRLFHEGLGTPEGQRASGLEALIGKVPYLNGGIFEEHKLEQDYKGIEIPDEAFESVFAFFDSYDWHLDDRPLRSDREINPDVLGYIFEKYINQKQMGAYYTKEDITEYITKNTVLPFLLERTRENCKVAFQPGGPVWSLLSTDPDRYIYPAVRKGVVDDDGNVIPLPEDIEPGVADVSKRGGWNRPAPAPYALPTETWREHVARRQRCLELREKLRNGEVTEVNDLITYNLNIRQFAQDVVEQSEGPDVVKAFYDALEGVSVLDPTCGSGAFLFAALLVLEPLYEACLDRMEAWLADEERLDRKHPGHRFRAVLESVAKHPNREYFIYKSIVINNLYGVDIMEEAVEICKLRLFLKLVSTVEDADQVEPLPDVDFNIRAGNTLVGFTSLDAVEDAITTMPNGQRRMKSAEEERELSEIRESAAFADRAYQHFRDQQTAYGGTVTAEDKQALRDQLDALDEKLNHHLARQYGRDPSNPDDYADWRQSHQPLHWFVEFYGIMASGGFDAIVGNPPWRELSALRGEYRLLGYQTVTAGNLYAVCIERILELGRDSSLASFIVQLPLTCSSRMQTSRDLLAQSSRALWVATFDDRPGKLFEGLQNCRSAIFVSQRSSSRGLEVGHFSGYQRWRSSARGDLFDRLTFTAVRPGPAERGLFPKYASDFEAAVFAKLASSAPLRRLSAGRVTQHFLFYQESARYWIKATLGLPYYAKNSVIGAPPHGRYVYFPDASTASSAAAVVNSSLFYNYFVAFTDCFHLSEGAIGDFPLPDELASDPVLQNLGLELMADLEKHAAVTRISTRGGDRIEYAEFSAGASKPVIDSVDRRLAKVLGFSPEELDFIINYDIKYRMGADDGDDGGN